MVKYTDNLTEFYQKNDKDVTKILLKYFKNVLKYHDIEDIKSEIYERLHKKEFIQDYRPLEIHIDEDNRTWLVKPNHAKFSTYICKFIFNYIYAYYNTIKPDNLCLSLDDYNDSLFNEEDNRMLHPLENDEDDFSETDSTELRIELERALDYLEKKTKHKGTLVCENAEYESIIKLIDSFGSKGCVEEDLLEIALKKKIERSEMTKLEEVLFDNYIKNLQDQGIIKEEKDKEGKTRYMVDDPERRSLYSLFRYYLQGFRDKEISEKFNMTVAGVGAMKRSLRKEISEIQNYQ